jgi:ribonuclease HI
MPWKPADFKGSRVWIEVDAAGAPRLVGGRVPMRYSDRPGSKTYNAAASNVRVDASAPAVDLDPAASAPASSSSAPKGSGFGKAGTRTDAQKGMAAEAARALIADLGDAVAIAYTDGSCRGNPGPAGSGVRLEMPGGRVAEACASLGRATNNVAELSAIGMALDLLDEAGWPSGAPAAVLTDSGYSHGVLCRGWKAKANTELIQALRARLAERPGVAVHWVAGHVGIPGNERADELANAGVDGLSRKRWIEP